MIEAGSWFIGPATLHALHAEDGEQKDPRCPVCDPGCIRELVEFDGFLHYRAAPGLYVVIDEADA